MTDFVQSPDGTRIAYDAAGRGPALVLLHGGGRDRRTWHDAGYVARLQDRFQVITLDLRGHGESDRPTDPAAYATDRLGDDILAVADACGADRFAVWGFSYGGNVARYVAVRSPRVARLILIGIPFGPGASGDFRRQILEARARWLPLLESRAAGTLDLEHLAPEEQAALASTDLPGTLAWLGGILDWPPVEPEDLPCPTLWVVGTENGGALASARDYEARLPATHVRLHLEPGLDHAGEFSAIDQVLPALLAFTDAP